MEDQELIKKILAHDRRALYIFYKTYTPNFFAYILSKVRSRVDAEEILHDTLFAFLEALRDFEGKASLKTFLFSICSHKIVDYYRRKKIKSIVFSQVPQLESLISPLLSPEEELDEKVLKEKVQKVLNTLLPRYRRVLVFKYLDGLSVAEIAQKMSITFKSAESILFRARKAFVEVFVSI